MTLAGVHEDIGSAGVSLSVKNLAGHSWRRGQSLAEYHFFQFRPVRRSLPVKIRFQIMTQKLLTLQKPERFVSSSWCPGTLFFGHAFSGVLRVPLLVTHDKRLMSGCTRTSRHWRCGWREICVCFCLPCLVQSCICVVSNKSYVIKCSLLTSCSTCLCLSLRLPICHAVSDS